MVVPRPESLVPPVVVLVSSRGLLLRHRLVVLESSVFFVSLEVVRSVVVALVALLAALVVLAVVLVGALVALVGALVALAVPRLVSRQVVLEVLPVLSLGAVASAAAVLGIAEFLAVPVLPAPPVMVPLRQPVPCLHHSPPVVFAVHLSGQKRGLRLPVPSCPDQIHHRVFHPTSPPQQPQHHRFVATQPVGVGAVDSSHLIALSL